MEPSGERQREPWHSAEAVLNLLPLDAFDEHVTFVVTVFGCYGDNLCGNFLRSRGGTPHAGLEWNRKQECLLDGELFVLGYLLFHDVIQLERLAGRMGSDNVK